MTSDVAYVGSQWRHWDLHVHSPESHNQSFEGATLDEKWEKYLAVLSDLQDVAVLGVTDYFSLAGYRKVADAHAQGTLPGIQLVLPNLELRLDVNTKAGKHINIHVLTSPEIVDELPSLLLSKLEFEWDGNPFTCQEDDLMRLGRAIKSTSTLDDRAAFKIGAEQFKVSVGDLRRAFQKSERLRSHALIALPNKSGDGNSGLQENASKSLRLELYRLADIIISSNPKDRDHFLGNGDNWSRAKAEEDYRCLKPCIFGSDAHDLVSIGNPPDNRRTWIKADTTFDGLMQICFEPEHRVRIGPTAPSEPIHRIERIALSIPEDATLRSDADQTQEPFCLRGTRELRFSSGLTCVIGGRGAGKSTLLNLLQEALTGGSEFFRDRSINRGSTSLDVADIVTVDVSSTASGVEFVSQNQVEAFAVDSARLTEAIYARLSKLDQDRQLKAAADRLESELASVDEMRSLVADRFGVEARLAALKSELGDLQRLTASLNDETYTALIGEADTVNASVSAVRTARTRLAELVRDLRRVLSAHPTEAQPAGSTGTLATAATEYHERRAELHTAVTQAVEDASSDIALADESQEEIQARGALDEINTRISKYLEERGISPENIQDLSTASARTTELQEEISRLEADLADIAIQIEEIDRYPDARSAFEDALHELIAPINNNLATRSEDELARISVQYSFDTQAAINDSLEMLAGTLSDHSDDRAARTDYVARVLSEVTWTDLPALEEFTKQVEASGSTERATSRRILAHLSQPGAYDDLRLAVERALADALTYKRIEVLYDEKPLARASFGQRCSAALIILLMLGNRPIVIDEPEAHLDSALIADLLVSLIKDRKTDRQIIFATHNANFVVNGDSELIHILSVDGPDATTIASTSLENREHRQDVLRLEGGAKAFLEREARYGFRDRFATPAGQS